MIETLTLIREQAVNMLETGVGSLTEDKKDAISTMLKLSIKRIPPLGYVREQIAELNKQWNIRPTPNGVCGVQQ